MSVDKKGDLRITGWSINVSWSDGKTDTLLDVPDDIAQGIDEWLSDLEDEENA